MILIPQFLDQPIVAQRVQDLGAGLVLPKEAKEEEMENAILEMERNYKGFLE